MGGNDRVDLGVQAVVPRQETYLERGMPLIRRVSPLLLTTVDIVNYLIHNIIQPGTSAIKTDEVISPEFEKFRTLTVEDAIKKAYQLSRRYLTDRYVPQSRVEASLASSLASSFGLLEGLVTAQRAAIYDGVTGLFTRQNLDVLLSQEMAQSRRHKTPLSVAMFDIDDFKSVNDTCGHGVGDDLLAAIANAIKRSVREEDSIVRYGGEEIMGIFPNSAPCQVAEMIRSRALPVVRRTVVIDSNGNEAKRTISTGIAQYSGETVRELTDKADFAMYKAKTAGKDRVCVLLPDGNYSFFQ
ncbi:MAG: diguanylate cyclase [Candidatus Woesearchaeota archaeon]